MTTTTASAPFVPDEASKACIAPPCAQPLDGMHKTLYAAFLVVVCALLFAINQIPRTPDTPPPSCAAHVDR